MTFTALRSAWLTTPFLPSWRLRLLAFLVRMWLLLALLCRTFFFAVTLNRFRAARCVFNFGIFLSS